jgi:hypothetical protein
MEAIALAFALGAGTVIAIKHGRSVAKRAVGWTAERAGWITGRVTDAVKDAKRIARAEFDRGRSDAPSGTQLAEVPASNGAHPTDDLRPPGR